MNHRLEQINNMTIDEKVQVIFRRQFKRLENALQPLDLSEIAKDTISKYMRFAELDVKELLRSNEDDKGNTAS